MRAPLLLFALVLSLCARAAAEIPDDLEGLLVARIVVDGDSGRVPGLREAGLRTGAAFNRELVRRVVERLAAAGRWNDVQVDVAREGTGVVVTVRLARRVLLAWVDYLGNRKLDNDELERASGLLEGAEVQPQTLAEGVRRIEQVYSEHGYDQVAIDADLRDTDDQARKVLVVRVNEGSPTRVRKVLFQGEAPPEDSGAVFEMDIDSGDIVDAHRIEERVRKGERHLRKRGFLEARFQAPRIERRDGRADVIIPSFVGPRYDVIIRGSDPLRRSAVEKVLELGEEPLLGRSALLTLRTRVRDLYNRHGFVHATVEVERIEKGPRRAELRVSIRPGPLVEVIRTDFPGASHFTPGFLRNRLLSVLEENLPGSSLVRPVDTETVDAIGFGGSPVWRREVPRPLAVRPDRIYYEPAYEIALEHLTELYKAQGFLHVSVGPVEVQNVSRTRRVVSIPILEGPQAFLHDVSVRGNEFLAAHEVLEALALERGMPFSYLEVEHGRQRVLDLYRDRGYLYVRVETTPAFSADGTRAEVLLSISERFPVRVGEIIVEGAERTSESLIRSLVVLEPGDIYRPALARLTEDRLMHLGAFQNVTVTPQDPDLPARVKPVVILVNERLQHELGTNLGFSTGEGFRWRGEYGWRNILGSGVAFRGHLTLAIQPFFTESFTPEQRALPLRDLLERDATLGLVIPRFPSIDLAFNVAHIRNNERNFGITKNTAVLNATWTLTRQLSLSFSPFNFELNTVDLFVGDEYEELLLNTTDPRLQKLLRVPEGKSTLYAVGAGLNLDFRDHPLNTTKGALASLGVEWAKTLATEQVELGATREQFVSNHLRLTMRANGYVPISQRFVLALELRLGRMLHLSDASETYPNRQFFLGGADTLRAYLEDAFIPQDLADEIQDGRLGREAVLRGGDAFLLLRTELRFLIYGPVYGGVFVEAGNLWADAARLNPIDLRPTSGAGLRFSTPAGFIAIDYGVVLLRREFLREPFGAFHFSMGLF